MGLKQLIIDRNDSFSIDDLSIIFESIDSISMVWFLIFSIKYPRNYFKKAQNPIIVNENIRKGRRGKFYARTRIRIKPQRYRKRNVRS